MDALTLSPPTLRLLRRTIRRICETFAQSILDHPHNRSDLTEPCETLAPKLWSESLGIVLHLFALLMLSQRDPNLSAEALCRSPSLQHLCKESPLNTGNTGLVGSPPSKYPSPSDAAEKQLIQSMRALPSVWQAFDWSAQPPLALEALGQIYEGLTNLAPGISSRPMVRLEWRGHEIIVPRDQASEAGTSLRVSEHIAPHSFYLSRGFGRKSRGSYYTPSTLVRELTAATLEPIVASIMAKTSPRAEDILSLRVVDPAMGAGTFLLHAGEYLAKTMVRLGGDSQSIAHCRAAVSRHCLYGIDRDLLATQLARWTIQLWTGDSSQPATDLGVHLRTGDSLTDPSLDRITLQSASRCAPAGPGAPNEEARPFDAVISNPPWEKILPLAREYFAGHDLKILQAPTARERNGIEKRLKSDPKIREGWNQYLRDWRTYQDTLRDRYQWQEVVLGAPRNRGVSSPHTGGQRTTRGHGDLYRYFVERAYQIVKPGGLVGLVLPNSFYANEGATGIRRLVFDRTEVRGLVGMTNRRRIFEASPGLRFALIVFRKGGRTANFPVAFGLTTLQHVGKVFELGRNKSRDSSEVGLLYDRAFLDAVSPEHLCLVECADRSTAQIIRRLYANGGRFGSLIHSRGIHFYQEMNMTNDSPHFVNSADVLSKLSRTVLAASIMDPDGVTGAACADSRDEDLRALLSRQGLLILHEKGTFRAYDDRLKTCPRYLCPRTALDRKPRAAAAYGHYRLAARATIHSGETEKAAFCLLPPGVVVGNSALAESRPQGRRLQDALIVLAVANSRAFNFAAFTRLSTNLNQFILRDLPAPSIKGCDRFLAHGALRLSCRHKSFAPLWDCVLGNHWSEEAVPHSWPAICGPHRRRLRAALDAVVALGYGLDHATYGDLLTRLPGDTLWWAADEWLAVLDELIRMGPEAFMKREDPYASIPLPLPVAGVEA